MSDIIELRAIGYASIKHPENEHESGIFRVLGTSNNPKQVFLERRGFISIEKVKARTKEEYDKQELLKSLK